MEIQIQITKDDEGKLSVSGNASDLFTVLGMIRFAEQHLIGVIGKNDCNSAIKDSEPTFDDFLNSNAFKDMGERAKNCLTTGECYTHIKESDPLASITVQRLSMLRGFGKKSLRETIEAIKSEYGIELKRS